MPFRMTFYANGNNVKPKLRLIAMPVMVLLGWLRAIMAEPSIGTRHFAGSNSVMYSAYCFNIIRIAGIEPLHCGLALGGFSMFCRCFVISYLAVGGPPIFCNSLTISCSASFTVLVGFLARFAATSNAVFVSSVFGKFRQWFEMLAFATSFRYDFSSHFCLQAPLLPVVCSCAL